MTMTAPDEASWHAGGCHCGAVRFRVRVRTWEAVRCNCSICTMKGFLHLIVEQADFSLDAGADRLTTYRFNTGIARHTFCSLCGIHPFYTPRSHPDGVSVNVNALDEAALRERFAIRPFDGRRWEESRATLR